MAKKVYIGVGGKARKVKKIYIGVGGKARKVKKGYIGVGGVARPFFTTGLEYYGKAPEMSFSKTNARTANIGNYVLVASSSSVDAYDASLTKTVATPLGGSPTSYLAAASNPSYAMFLGGNVKAYNAYNSSLTLTTGSDATYAAVYSAAASVGSYVLHGGGRGSSETNIRNYMDAYNTSLTKSKPSNLSTPRSQMAGGSTSSYALFIGGTKVDSSMDSGTSNSTAGQGYNSSLTRSSEFSVANMVYAPNYGQARKYANFNNSVILGSNHNNGYQKLGVVNNSLTAAVATNSLPKHLNIDIAVVEGYAIFAGGSNDKTTAAHALDQSYTITEITGISEPRYYFCTGTIGSYALLFSGNGYDSANKLTTLKSVEVYTA